MHLPGIVETKGVTGSTALAMMKGPLESRLINASGVMAATVMTSPDLGTRISVVRLLRAGVVAELRALVAGTDAAPMGLIMLPRAPRPLVVARGRIGGASLARRYVLATLISRCVEWPPARVPKILQLVAMHLGGLIMGALFTLGKAGLRRSQLGSLLYCRG